MGNCAGYCITDDASNKKKEVTLANAYGEGADA